MRSRAIILILVTSLALDCWAKDDKEEFNTNLSLESCEEVIIEAAKHRWTKAEVKRGLKALYENGFPVHAKYLHSPPEPQAMKLLAKTLGFPTTPHRLYFYGSKLYGSFPAALKAARIPVEKAVLRPNQSDLWSEEVVKRGLKSLMDNGYSVHGLALKNNSDPKAIDIVSRAVGFRTRPRVLGEKTTEIFGTIQNALWTKDLVHKVLQAFHERGDVPNIAFFKNGIGGDDALKFLNQTLGFESNLYTVIVQAKRFHNGNFAQAIKEAGLGEKRLSQKRYSQPWTKELTHKGLVALHKAGYKPKANFLTNSTDEKANQILSKAVGFETGLATLYQRARLFHDGDFSKALAAAGLPVDEILSVDRGLGWNRALVIKSLQFIYSTGQIPTASFLQKARDRELEKKLSENLGIEVRLSTIYLKAIDFFKGDYQAALEAANLPVRSIVKKFSNKRWSRIAVHRGLKALYDAGINPSATRLRDDRTEESELILQESLGFPSTLVSLYRKAREFHNDNFQQALAESGVPVRQVVSRLSTRDLTLESIRGALRALFERGYVPNTALFISRNPEATEVLSDHLGFPTTLKTLIDHIRNRYSTTLHEQLNKAGLPGDLIVSRQREAIWSREIVRAALYKLNELGFTPYAPYLRKAENPEAVRVLTETVGYPMRLSALYVQALKQYRGNFTLALRDAGLSPEEIVKRRIGALTPLQIMGSLQELHRQGIKPNTKTLLSGNMDVLRIISNHLKALVTPSHLYNQAREHFGSLRSALLKSKLPADEIIERYSHRIDYSATIPTHVERIVEDGEVRYQTYIGNAPNTPDEVLAKTDLFALLDREIPPHLKGLAEQVIDVILSCELGSIGPDDILEILSAEMGENSITIEAIAEVFEILGQSEDLRSYLME